MTKITYKVIETPESHDSNDVRFYRDGAEIYGYGYQPKDALNEICIVKCPNCQKENYAPAVATGSCAFCGWKVGE